MTCPRCGGLCWEYQGTWACANAKCAWLSRREDEVQGMVAAAEVRLEDELQRYRESAPPVAVSVETLF